MSEPNETHRMGKRCQKKNYRLPGAYHITINVAERQWHPLGQTKGGTDCYRKDGGRGTNEKHHNTLSHD